MVIAKYLCTSPFDRKCLSCFLNSFLTFLLLLFFFFSGLHQQILDNVTLTNLDVIPYGPDSSLEGTLLERLDNCSTPFGEWLLTSTA